MLKQSVIGILVGALAVYTAAVAGWLPLLPKDGAPGTGIQAPGDDLGNDGGAQIITQSITLTEDQVRLAELESVPVARGTMAVELRLTGEVVLDQDRLAHLAPRVTGIVRDVYRTLGDEVEAGEVLASLDSRELAESKSEYLAAQSRLVLAQAKDTFLTRYELRAPFAGSLIEKHLTRGERVVARGSFLLKSELEKASFED